MANETLTPDGNTRNIAGAVTDDSNAEIRKLRIDDTTKGLKVLLVGGVGTGTVTSVATSGSLTGGTITTSGTLSLVNDNATPGNSYYYGTNSSGTKGFFVLPTGAGTVTSVSVVTANGVSGSVATATTTPAITLTLGAITPTTVNGNTITTGTGTLTLGAGKIATISNTLAFTGTDGSSVAFGTGGTVLYNGGALGTPSSGTATNLTGTASGLTSGNSTAVGGITITGTPAVGYIPTATSTSAATWQAPISAISKSTIMFFAATSVLGSSTLYLGNGQGVTSASEGAVIMIFPLAGTIKNFYLVTGSTQPSGGNLVATMRKNSADQSVTATVPTNGLAQTVSDTTHSFTVAAGDNVTIKLVNASGSTSATIGNISFEFDAS